MDIYSPECLCTLNIEVNMQMRVLIESRGSILQQETAGLKRLQHRTHTLFTLNHVPVIHLRVNLATPKIKSDYRLGAVRLGETQRTRDVKVLMKSHEQT